jgi:hypothetical protein
MATKKPAPKKPAAKKPAAKAPTKKTPAKKAPVKKSVAAKTVTASPKKRTTKKSASQTAKMQSFRVYRGTDNFTSGRFSRQTVYWIILLTIIIATQLWIINLQLEIAELTNELITNSSEI